MPLTPYHRQAIRRHVLDTCVPRAKTILESGGFVPEDMDDAEAYAEVEAVLAKIAREIREKIPLQEPA